MAGDLERQKSRNPESTAEERDELLLERKFHLERAEAETRESILRGQIMEVAAGLREEIGSRNRGHRTMVFVAWFMALTFLTATIFNASLRYDQNRQLESLRTIREKLGVAGFQLTTLSNRIGDMRGVVLPAWKKPIEVQINGLFRQFDNLNYQFKVTQSQVNLLVEGAVSDKKQLEPVNQ